MSQNPDGQLRKLAILHCHPRFMHCLAQSMGDLAGVVELAGEAIHSTELLRVDCREENVLMSCESVEYSRRLNVRVKTAARSRQTNMFGDMPVV